jgi:cysteine desulfuration protein SufE
MDQTTPAPLAMDATVDELADELYLLGDWEQRYRYVIDLGRGLDPLTESEHDDANKVRGCASQVWLIARRDPSGRLNFRGDSDAHIVRGLIAILLSLYGGRTPTEILAFDAKVAFERLGLTARSRVRGSTELFSMVEGAPARGRTKPGLTGEAATPFRWERGQAGWRRLDLATLGGLGRLSTALT